MLACLANMKLALVLLSAVCAEKMTTEVGESTNMHYMTNRLARDQSCKAALKDDYWAEHSAGRSVEM